MSRNFDLSGCSEKELASLIDEAQAMRQKLRDSREREGAAAADGSKGQDVHDPEHGAITAPTPREVKDEGRRHGTE